MFSLIKLLFFLAFVALFIWFGRTVKLGKFTLFDHISRIWKTPEAQDLVEGAKERAGPAMDKLKHGVEAGIEAASDHPADAGPTPKADAGPTPPPTRIHGAPPPKKPAKSKPRHHAR